jgi:hypothetical protein
MALRSPSRTRLSSGINRYRVSIQRDNGFWIVQQLRRKSSAIAVPMRSHGALTTFKVATTVRYTTTSCKRWPWLSGTYFTAAVVGTGLIVSTAWAASDVSSGS